MCLLFSCRLLRSLLSMRRFDQFEFSYFRDNSFLRERHKNSNERLQVTCSFVNTCLGWDWKDDHQWWCLFALLKHETNYFRCRMHLLSSFSMCLLLVFPQFDYCVQSCRFLWLQIRTGYIFSGFIFYDSHFKTHRLFSHMSLLTPGTIS